MNALRTEKTPYLHLRHKQEIEKMHHALQAKPIFSPIPLPGESAYEHALKQNPSSSVREVLTKATRQMGQSDRGVLHALSLLRNATLFVARKFGIPAYHVSRDQSIQHIPLVDKNPLINK